MTREEREDAINCFKNKLENEVYGAKYNKLAIEALEQVPQSFEWCDTCKEYDQENHCCHRWSKVIRDTVEEMKQGYERDVLDKIRAEIKAKQDTILYRYDYYDDGVMGGLDFALKLIDKAETEAAE